jgi:hypothetical protein
MNITTGSIIFITTVMTEVLDNAGSGGTGSVTDESSPEARARRVTSVNGRCMMMMMMMMMVMMMTSWS